MKRWSGECWVVSAEAVVSGSGYAHLRKDRWSFATPTMAATLAAKTIDACHTLALYVGKMASRDALVDIGKAIASLGKEERVVLAVGTESAVCGLMLKYADQPSRITIVAGWNRAPFEIAESFGVEIRHAAASELEAVSIRWPSRRILATLGPSDPVTLNTAREMAPDAYVMTPRDFARLRFGIPVSFPSGRIIAIGIAKCDSDLKILETIGSVDVLPLSLPYEPSTSTIGAALRAEWL